MTIIIKKYYICSILIRRLDVMGKCEQCIVREFSSLRALTREELLTISETKTSVVIKKGELLFEEDENLNGVYCIKEGSCKLTKLNSNGKDSILKLVSQGELLGQRSMISEESSNLSATALEDMKVCFIPKTDIMKYFSNNNAFSLLITKDICNHLKDADEVLANHTHRTVKERLAMVLLHLNDFSGIDSETGALKLQLSREDLANMVGTATESCIRLLSEFKKEGWIELSGKKIILKNLAQLKNLAE